MKIIFLAYRQWSLDVYPSIKKHPRVHESVLCKTHEELLKLNLNKFNLIISCGWSEELGDEITSKIEAIGVHCAELDRYSYGSPLQLQIIDGVNRTKHRIFSFTFDKSSERAHTHNRLFSHEVDLDLSGNMSDVLYQMTSTSIVLFNRYLDDMPNITWQEWPEESIVRPKRNPIDSRLNKEDLLKMNTEELYNFFRCLEDPYPNGYVEDEIGKLFIKHVGFKKKIKMAKVILCGYRDWAKNIFEKVSLHPNVKVLDTISSQEEYLRKVSGFNSDIDLILFVGWSWIIPKETTDKFLCLGIHPSDLPNYRGGSPLQHQIINGVIKSKVSLMTLSSVKLDAGEIWIQEELNLEGKNMTQVFNNITESSIKMLNIFFDNYPDIFPKDQDITLGSYFKRRTAQESLITIEQMNKLSLIEIYNFIRCLTSPYPNAYLEDDYGNKLFFNEVTYVAKEE